MKTYQDIAAVILASALSAAATIGVATYFDKNAARITLSPVQLLLSCEADTTYAGESRELLCMDAPAQAAVDFFACDADGLDSLVILANGKPWYREGIHGTRTYIDGVETHVRTYIDGVETRVGAVGVISTEPKVVFELRTRDTKGHWRSSNKAILETKGEDPQGNTGYSAPIDPSQKPRIFC